MTRYEFINGLRKALENNLNSTSVQEHVNFYNEYINNEIRNGRTEAEVITELGDPWAIAKTIISSEEAGTANHEEYTYASSDREYQRNETSSSSKVHIFGLDKWWKKLLLILGIIGVIMIVFSIITGLISLVAPLVMPIIFITLIIRLFKKLK